MMLNPKCCFFVMTAFLAVVTLPVHANDVAAKIDALFAPPLIKEGAPGAAVLVVQDGKKIVNKGYGLANLKTNSPITPTTVFELASCSKQFTAMAVMILAERRKLSYNDPITKFFPEFPAWGGTITVAHLLHHTGGLPDYFDAYDKTDQEGVPTSTEMLRLIEKKKKPRFPPGAKYDYSNSGYMVLAQIVEKASGQKFPEFVRANIFAPLGMKQSLVYDETKPKFANRAHCYIKKSGEFEDTSKDDLSCIYGDGSVRSTLNDLFLWDQALYTGKLVSAATLERAFTSGTTNDGEDVGYGFGWETGKFHGAKMLSHTGLWLDFNNYIMRVPERHLTVVVLSNRANFASDTLAAKIANLCSPSKRKSNP